MDIHENMALLNPWFASLPIDIRRKLCKNVSIINLDKDEELIHQDDDVPFTAMVRSGAQWAERASYNGGNYVMAIIGPGFLGHVEWPVLGLTSRFTVKACVPSEVFLLPADDIRDLIRDCPDFAFKVIDLMGRTCALLEEFQFMMANNSSLQRIAWSLALVATGYRGLCLAIRSIPVSQVKISENILLGRQTVNGVLKELSAMKAIAVHREQIEILNPPLLERLSGLDRF